MDIITFGVGGRIRECERVLTERLAGLSGRLFLLPIPTSRDKKYITDTPKSIESLCAELSPGDDMVGYNLPYALRDFADRLGVSVYDGGLDERFLSANAALTARGTLGYILTHSDRDIAELSVGIVGYGRIGRRLTNLMLLLGADARVYTGRESVAYELGAEGVAACVIGEDCNTDGLDILINTAPAPLLDPASLPPETEIIDLASGCVYPPSDRLTRLPSVPEKMFPVTAGRLYAEGALRALYGGAL